MSRLSDVQELGYLPLQDHRAESEVDLQFRAAVFACRVEARDEFGRYKAEGHQTELKIGSNSGIKTIGDLIGGTFFEPEKDERVMGSWSFALPSILMEASPPGPPGSRGNGDGSGGRKGGGGESGGGNGKGNGGGNSRMGKVLPIKDTDYADDDRYKEIEAAIQEKCTGLPKGIPGIVLSTTNEREQETLFLPTYQPLIAANNAGDPALSSYVYDLTDEDELDHNYKAQLHSMMRVIKWTNDPGDGSLAWQLAPSGLDSAYGNGLVIDGGGAHASLKGTLPGVFPSATSKPPTPDYVVALATQNQSGPFDTGTAGDQHHISQTAEGWPVNALHLSAKAYFIDSVGDGPLAFEPRGYETNLPPSQFYVETHLRWDPKDSHDFLGGSGTGKWKWQTDVPFYIPPPTEKPPPPPENGDPPPPEETIEGPVPTPGVFIPIGPHSPGTGTGVFVPVGPPVDPDSIKDSLDPPSGTPDPFPGVGPEDSWWPGKHEPGRPDPEGGGPGPGLPDDPIFPPPGGEFVDPDFKKKNWLEPGTYEAPTDLPPGMGPIPPLPWGPDLPWPWGSCCVVGWSDELRRKMLGGYLSQTHTFPGAFRSAGGLVFRPFATARGSYDLTRGGRLGIRELSGQIAAPDTAVIVAVGENPTSRWHDFVDDGRASHGGSRTGPGGIAVLPPQYGTPDGLRGVLEGSLQPASSSYPWSENTRPIKVFFPGGLASLEFSHPAPGGQRAGVSIFQDSVGLVIAPRDADGDLVSTAGLQVGEAGVTVTGKLNVTGLIDPTGLVLDKQSSTSIGGSLVGIWASNGTVTGTEDGAAYWDQAGVRRRVAAPLKLVGTPSLHKIAATAIQTNVLSYSGIGLVETAYTVDEPTIAMVAAAAGEGAAVKIAQQADGNMTAVIRWRVYTPEGMNSWATEGIRVRHQLTAIGSGTVSVALAITDETSGHGSSTRTGLTSADGSRQWVGIAGAALTGLSAGEWVHVELTLSCASTGGVTLDVGRIEYNWL